MTNENKLRTSKPVIYSRRCSIRKLDHLVSSSTAIRLLLFLISNYNLISVNWFPHSHHPIVIFPIKNFLPLGDEGSEPEGAMEEMLR